MSNPPTPKITNNDINEKLNHSLKLNNELLKQQRYTNELLEMILAILVVLLFIYLLVVFISYSGNCNETYYSFIIIIIAITIVVSLVYWRRPCDKRANKIVSDVDKIDKE